MQILIQKAEWGWDGVFAISSLEMLMVLVNEPGFEQQDLKYTIYKVPTPGMLLGDLSSMSKNNTQILSLKNIVMFYRQRKQ